MQKTEKNIDFIDACVWIDAFFTSVENCTSYLHNVGYKFRNMGAITVSILGEIKTMIITKIPEEKDYLRYKVSEDIIKIISKLRNENKLRIYKFLNVSDSLLTEIKEKAYHITEDDALHIGRAINIKCQNFVTTDTTLFNNHQLRGWLKKHKKLKIKNPY